MSLNRWKVFVAAVTRLAVAVQDARDHRHNSSPLGEELICGLRAHPFFVTYHLREITHQDANSISCCLDEIFENPSGRKLDQQGVRDQDARGCRGDLEGRRGPG